MTHRAQGILVLLNGGVSSRTEIADVLGYAKWPEATPQPERVTLGPDEYARLYLASLVHEIH